MRIGEIAVVGSKVEAKRNFIKAVSDDVEVQNDSLIFGRIKINEQLIVHLYGLEYLDEDIQPSWDLVSKKLLGYIVLFNWDAQEDLTAIQPMVNALEMRYSAPIIVAAGLKSGLNDIPPQLIDTDFALSEQCQFIFCNINDPASVKHTLLVLINTVLDSLK